MLPMNTVFFLWLIIAFSFLILEVGNPGLFYFLSFSCAALVVATISLFCESVIIQGITFLAIAVMVLFILKKWIYKREKSVYQSNANALKGKQAIVTLPIHPAQPGYVKINGEFWLARTTDTQTILLNQLVVIKEIKGSHVVVTPYKSNVSQEVL
jgi:membrane protein implicated in regulation of membrane protease activity